jgi:hypothetical protein
VVSVEGVGGLPVIVVVVSVEGVGGLPVIVVVVSVEGVGGLPVIVVDIVDGVEGIGGVVGVKVGGTETSVHCSGLIPCRSFMIKYHFKT